MSYVEHHAIENALEKEYDRLAGPILEGKAKSFDDYQARIGELRGIRTSATIIKQLFIAARG